MTTPRKTLTLHRSYFKHGTFSTLCDDNGNPFCVTVEPPWKNNQAGVSCVPEGTYELIPHESPRFGRCYALSAPELGVTIFGKSQRTHILFHVANLASQLEGCIAPGECFGVLYDKRTDANEWAVMSSGIAFDRLMAYLNNEPAQLVIRRA